MYTFGLPPVRSNGRKKSKKAAKKKKKKYDNWFESCNAAQLKELCKASKLAVSGTKQQLVARLLESSETHRYGFWSQDSLKRECEKELLVKTGNKYDQVLRLLHAGFGTGTAKRAATETVIDEDSGQEVQVLKKRKIVLQPSTIYTRVEKRIRAVSQKKFQSYWGSKWHAPEVVGLMDTLMKQQVLENNMVETDPRLAFEMAKAPFQALYDHWAYMERPGYAHDQYRAALATLRTILEPTTAHLTPKQIEGMVTLLESIEACSEYGVDRRRDVDHLDQTIRVLMPHYDKATRPKRTGKTLHSTIQGLCWLNGIEYKGP